jgi:uncharacterized membrane-anchored protein
VKILATTVGETGGDALSMTLKLGYARSTLVFLALFVAALAVQVTLRRLHPWSYWTVVVATTTVGTTTSDFLDRTVGLGYPRSSLLLLGAVGVVLLAWRGVSGAVKVDRIVSRTDETFYWLTILVSNTLGTALGDFVATSSGLGFEGGALVFAGLLAVVAAARLLTRLPSAVLFWTAYVLTRPLGATLGDTLTKPHEEGGLQLGRISSTLAIAAGMVVVVALARRRTRTPAV